MKGSLDSSKDKTRGGFKKTHKKKYSKDKLKHQGGWRKTLGRIMSISAALVLLYVGITFWQVYSAARNDEVSEKTRVDAIVVLGAAQYNGTPSPVLQARLDHALDLYKRNVAPMIIVTGGRQPGDTTTEAAASANYFLNRGVDDSHILREVQGVSTYDSLRDTAAFIKNHDIKKVVIVTDGFHELRAKLIAEEVGMEAIASPARNSPITGSDEWENFFTETVRVAFGRIVGFRRVSKDSSLAGLVRGK